jgi:hypothetical protein
LINAAQHLKSSQFSVLLIILACVLGLIFFPFVTNLDNYNKDELNWIVAGNYFYHLIRYDLNFNSSSWEMLGAGYNSSAEFASFGNMNPPLAKYLIGFSVNMFNMQPEYLNLKYYNFTSKSYGDSGELIPDLSVFYRARLMSSFFAFLTSLLVFFICLIIFNWKTGFFSAILFALGAKIDITRATNDTYLLF